MGQPSIIFGGLKGEKLRQAQARETSTATDYPEEEEDDDNDILNTYKYQNQESPSLLLPYSGFPQTKDVFIQKYANFSISLSFSFLRLSTELDLCVGGFWMRFHICIPTTSCYRKKNPETNPEASSISVETHTHGNSL